MKAQSRTAAQIKALAKKHSKAAIKVLAGIMNQADGPATARVSAAQALLDRGWGKAAQPPEGEEGLGALNRIERVIVDPEKVPEKAGRTLRIDTPRVFGPLLKPARYKGAHGGRGSGKSHFFAELLIEDCLCERGMLAVCIREYQKSLKDSSKRLIEDKLKQLGLGEADGFKIFEKQIQTPGGGIIIFTGLQDRTAESIKSLEGFQRAWIEEAQVLSQRSLSLLRPTIRAKGSQIWASWNPRRKGDAIDDFFRSRKPKDAAVVEVNWRDNPWFSQVLEEERLTDLKLYPDLYDHVWEGGYAKALEGAYYARGLAEAKAQRRICRLAADPLLPVRAFFDIGGSGASADAMAIWIAQFVDREIRVLDYIEGVGQVLAYYVRELRARGWGAAQCWLPHDGVTENSITGKRYEDRARNDSSAPAPDR